mmetsp:Transcript_3768/g.9423  ORF Transcript_3768/g.9423 Transcript_3768/m.9423 type:complete len:221 (-) Transcript_3768:212-874(-)
MRVMTGMRRMRLRRTQLHQLLVCCQAAAGCARGAARAATGPPARAPARAPRLARLRLRQRRQLRAGRCPRQAVCAPSTALPARKDLWEVLLQCPPTCSPCRASSRSGRRQARAAGRRQPAHGPAPSALPPCRPWLLRPPRVRRRPQGPSTALRTARRPRLPAAPPGPHRLAAAGAAPRQHLQLHRPLRSRLPPSCPPRQRARQSASRRRPWIRLLLLRRQ